MERSIAISAPLVGSDAAVLVDRLDRARATRPASTTTASARRRSTSCPAAARYTWGPTGLEHAFEADAGDFIYIPAGEIHVEENASATEPLVVVLTRNCPDSHVEYMDGGPGRRARRPGAVLSAAPRRA